MTEHVKEGVLLYVREDIPSKQIELKSVGNEAFQEFFVEPYLRGKSDSFAAVIIQIKIIFCLTYILLAKNMIMSPYWVISTLNQKKTCQISF